MDVNRSPTQITLQTFTPDPNNMSATEGASSHKSFGEKVTARSKDLLVRMQMHGTLQQKQMAHSAHTALEAGTFIHNPAVLLPVYQHGTLSTIDEREGVLLANFVAHNEEFELMALAFRETRYLAHDSGPVRVIALDHANDLPEPKSASPQNSTLASPSHTLSHSRPILIRSRSENVLIKNNKTSIVSRALDLVATKDSDSELTKARRLMQWESAKFRWTPMHLQMAASLAEKRIKEGQEKGKKISHWSAVPSAHMEIIKAKMLSINATNLVDNSYNPPEKPREKDVPKGLVYEFPKHTFAVFHDDFLRIEKADEVIITEKVPEAPVPSVNHKMGRPQGGVINSALIAQLDDLLQLSSEDRN
jgi:hypothetical protein